MSSVAAMIPPRIRARDVPERAERATSPDASGRDSFRSDLQRSTRGVRAREASPEETADREASMTAAEVTAVALQLVGPAVSPPLVQVPVAIAVVNVSPVAASPAAPEPVLPPMTPLEQAIHDLIEQISTEPDDESREDSSSEVPVAMGEQLPRAVHATSTGRPVALVAVREPAPLSEPAANPSHMHFVIDDGSERITVTIAVRGTDVNVAFRGGEEGTASAIARNAASLDHAMRARSLDLTSFTAEHDLGHDRQPHQTRDEPDAELTDSERFTLEEIA